MDWPEIVPPFCELYLRLLKNKNNSIKVLTNTTEPNDGDETSISVMEKQFSFAIAQGRTEIAECLARCLLAAEIPTQSSPLVEATRKQASDLVIRLLAQDHGGFNAEVQAIVVAAEHCNIDILRILTEHNISALLNAGEAAMEAATKSAHVGVPNRLEVITFILDNGVLITADKSLLLRATNSGDAELLQVLFDHDIGLEFRSEALVLATSNGDSKSTELLLRHGAERTDRLAVIRALNLGSPISAANLIKAGFQVEGRYLDKSRTALHYAAEKGFDDVVQCLLERKVLIDVYDREHKTPLHLAAQRGRARCAKLLLDHGADVLSEDGEGNIPLDLAEGGKHTATEEIIKGEMQRLFDKLQEERRLRVVADDPGID
ncbi:ankyrin [Colletotrichum sublineola]|uniref:Putative ankyrin-1 n=1 Tax=Colletotrichum sublineola TaxID=1173701 RepID=A0A066X554_COLSU|nr:ankyrin [Colletotrichum sublineola]KDN64258.1 putative ankyrin-1 [Colletotrichum sublineola]